MEFIDKLCQIGFNGDKRLINLYSSYMMEAFIKEVGIATVRDIKVSEFLEWVVETDGDVLLSGLDRDISMDDDILSLIELASVPVDIIMKLHGLGFTRDVTVGSIGILTDFLIEVRNVAPCEFRSMLSGRSILHTINSLIEFYSKFRKIEV